MADPTSSSQQRPPSAFQWPIPPNAQVEPDITVKEILDKFQHDPELLKIVLTAKAEEDKKRAAQSTLEIERARIQQREMDLQAMRNVYYHPFQQQVIARITSPLPEYPPQHHLHLYQQPHQPSQAYNQAPHSAHPLCPPAQPYQKTNNANNNNNNNNNNRDNRDNNDKKMTHDQVMEALKAKIIRGSSKRAARTLPPPPPAPSSVSSGAHHPATPSPRSAKPILPPIDTSVGRNQHALPPFSATTAGIADAVSLADTAPRKVDRRVKSLSPPPHHHHQDPVDDADTKRPKSKKPKS